jgi:Predicted UDP-glucose 6-dehydrogenase
MKIGVVGVGMVGGAISFGFRRIGHEVLQHDIKLETKLENVLPAELVFICVPTKQLANGFCDITIVRDVVKNLNDLEYEGLVVIKSTVTPGTTDTLQKLYPNLQLAFCPEFLRERAAFSDFVEANDVCIIGTFLKWTTDGKKIEEAHGNLPKVFVHLTPLEAELAKYFSNTFNALRIVFANQFYDVCKMVGADYSAVKNAIVKRHNIGDHYLECNEQFRAFGGSCLPKDTVAFAAFVKAIGVDAPLFQQIVDINNALLGPEHNNN